MVTLCLISARNLGDAVIHGKAARTLVERGFAERVVVWTRPESVVLFKNILNCEVVSSPFPMGRGHKFRPGDGKKFLSAIATLREKKFDKSIDFIGDQRERWLATIIGSRRHFYIGWSRGHAFRELIRNPFGRGRPDKVIRTETINVYEAIDEFIDAICPKKNASQSQIIKTRRAARLNKELQVIGLHPSASQECKLWPDHSWRALATKLLDRKISIVVFCAPNEREHVATTFSELEGDLELFSGSLVDFKNKCRQMDVMIGLDSFSVHMADSVGTPTVTLNAGNPVELWRPPQGVVIGDGGGCKHYPCFNRPQCSGVSKYVCVRSISVDDVMKAIGLIA